MLSEPQQWRLQQLRRLLREQTLDAALLVHLPLVRYLTRFSGSNGTVLLTRRSVHFITDHRYAEQVKPELAQLPGLQLHLTRQTLQLVAQLCAKHRVQRLGIQAFATTLDQATTLRRSLRGVRLVHLPNLDHVRMVKFPVELEQMRRAATIASEVYEEVLGLVRPGMRECEVAAELSYRARLKGSEADAFEIIVVAGEHGAFVHGRATERRLRKGDVVTVDFGCRVGGFHSDMTRTFVIGKPSRQVQRAWQAVSDAHQRALDVLHAGVRAADVDRAARDVIKSAGFGDYFTHSLGHGIGIEVHEPPLLSATNTDGIVPAGCVVTVEPGIYISGAFGMRLEDDVYVGEQSIELLTTADRSLRQL